MAKSPPTRAETRQVYEVWVESPTRLPTRLIEAFGAEAAAQKYRDLYALSPLRQPIVKQV